MSIGAIVPQSAAKDNPIGNRKEQSGDIQRLEEQKQRLQEELKDLKQNKGTEEQANPKAESIQKQIQSIDEQIQAIRKQDSSKIPKQSAAQSPLRFDEFQKSSREDVFVGIYQMGKDENGKSKVIFDAPLEENEGKDADKSIKNADEQENKEIDEPKEADNKDSAKGADKKEDDDKKKELTTIKTNCKEHHWHGPQCPHTVSTIPATGESAFEQWA